MYLLSWIHLLSESQLTNPPASVSVCILPPVSTCVGQPWIPQLTGPSAVPTFTVTVVQPCSSQCTQWTFSPWAAIRSGTYLFRCEAYCVSLCFSLPDHKRKLKVLKACLYPKRKPFPCLMWLMYSMISVKPLESPGRQLERKFLLLRTGALLGSLWLLEGPLLPQELALNLNCVSVHAHNINVICNFR
jgi:hypothetical protein